LIAVFVASFVAFTLGLVSIFLPMDTYIEDAIEPTKTFLVLLETLDSVFTVFGFVGGTVSFGVMAIKAGGMPGPDN